MFKYIKIKRYKLSIKLWHFIKKDNEYFLI
jgi:hypothetical protein